MNVYHKHTINQSINQPISKARRLKAQSVKGENKMAATSTKNVTNIQDKTATVEHIGYLVANEYDELTLMIEPLPELLGLLIERYHLDSRNLSREEKNDLSEASTKLYCVLNLIQDTLASYIAKVNAIDYRTIAKNP